MEKEPYDFDSKYASTYSKVCPTCGELVEVSTQKDQNPEYYTPIFVKCKCGTSIKFKLPVN